MPQSIPRGLSRESILGAIADLDAGVEHPFGAPTGYELVHQGRRYPPKAVIGLACRELLGRILAPDEFSGGEAPGQANVVLRELGFTVEKKGPPNEPSGGRDWSVAEADLIVADYFLMLRAELAGDAYSKADHNRRLRERLDGRSKGSVEFKHQNISAVLIGMGLPYIEGYRPARNYQKTVLPQAVEDYLGRHPEFLERLAEGRVLNPVAAPSIGGRPIEAYFEERPEGIADPCATRDDKPWLSRRGKTLDFARRDALNRTLGRLGEEFVLAVEKRRLLSFGRDDLAAKVEWVAVTCGDGLGFDVLSFDAGDDSEQYIEVKTTGLGKHFPFYVTATEVRCSEDCPERFRLYRVFDFARIPRMYVVGGSLSRECHLEPVSYRVSP
jgi:hypothetical protein